VSIWSRLNFWKRSAETLTPQGDMKSWEDLVLGGGSSRRSVSPDHALTFSAVYASINIIAETIATLPKKVYVESSDNIKTYVKDHAVAMMFRTSPNQFQDWFKFMYALVVQMLMHGNGYALIVRTKFGAPKNLRFLKNGDVQPMYDMYGDKPYLYYMVFGKPVEAYNIIHITSLGNDGIVGKSPIQLASESVLMGMNTRNTLSNFYEGNMKSKPAFLTDKVLEDKAFERLKVQLQNTWTKDRIMLLEDNLKVQEMSISPKDAETIASMNWSVEDIARIYRVPLHKLQSLGRSTNNNIEQQSIDFVTDTVVPNVERIEQQFKAKLFFEDELDYFVDMDVDYLLRGQSDKRAAYYAQRFQVGSITPNQIRQREGENPETDEFMNKYYLNGTYRPIDAAYDTKAKQNEQGNTGV